MSEPMKVNMLGRDIFISRKSMLSDGYCLSTVNHAERLASGPDTYTVTSPDGGDSAGVVWLRGHVPFCKQCRTANDVKNRITAYIGRHFPSKIVEWNQGRLSKEMMGQIVSALIKTDRKFMITAIENMNYNLKPLHLQAIEDRDALANGVKRSENHEFEHLIGVVEKSRVVMVDTGILFEAWQLIGSSPLYEKKRLIRDFEKFNIKPPFPSTYFAFPEGINRHLIRHFFDNMPAELFGGASIKGVLFWENGDVHAMMEHDILSDPALDLPMDESDPDTESRAFLWAALMRAIQDKVFTSSPAPEFEKARDAYLSGAGPREAKAPEPFYAVRVNPNSGFRDPARVYGKRHINWTHRWDVAGHWRRYKDGKRVWISSYVKGPEDKPFVPAVRVYGPVAAARGRWEAATGLLHRFMGWVKSRMQR